MIAEGSDRRCDWNHKSADFAGCPAPESSRVRSHWRRLYDLGARWMHESYLASPELSDTAHPLEARVTALADRFSSWRTVMLLTPMCGDLLKLRGINGFMKDFDVNDEDRKWLAKPRPFTAPR